MDPCPDEVKERAEILCYYGVSGFRMLGGDVVDRFMICMFNDKTLVDNLDAIRDESGCTSLTLDAFDPDDTTGVRELHVHWRDHDKIHSTLDTLLKRGYSFLVFTGDIVFFDAKIDTEFSLVVLEKKIIELVKSEFLRGETPHVAYSCEWNYTSAEGKIFAKALEADKSLKFWNARWDYNKLPLFQSYDKKTLCSL